MKINISKNTIRFTPIYSFPKDSHTIFIKNLEFENGEIYPNKITFLFPFETKGEITISGTRK